MGKKGKETKNAAPAKKNQSVKSFFKTRKTETKIPTTSDEDTASVSFSFDEDVATVPGPPTPNRNCVKAKDPPEVVEAVVDNDDLKPPERNTFLPPAPLPLDWTQLGKSPANFFDVFGVKEVKWGMTICNCGCQEIADSTTLVQFNDEHANYQAWLSEKFDTRTDYSIKQVPIRILSNFKHVEMYWEAAREM